MRHKSRYQRVATHDPETRDAATPPPRHTTASLATAAPPRAHVRSMSRSKLKTVKLTLTVILCYIVCWGPFFIAQMWAAWDVNAPFTGKVASFSSNEFPFACDASMA